MCNMFVKNFLVVVSTLIYVVFAGVIFAQSGDYNAEKEAAERIQRQLELAEELRNERLKKQREKEKQLEQEEQLEKRCNKLKDDLRRFGERRRWYQLDEYGERVYLSDAEIKHKKQSLQKEYDQRCEEF
ncbi:hypothetical protein [Kaarinaea lacus]